LVHRCFGAGIYGPLYKYKERIPMGILSTVFSAELMAILRCTELLLTKNVIRRRMHISCDTRTALAGLVKNYYPVIPGLGMYASAGRNK
jgi:hypothetical protein